MLQPQSGRSGFVAAVESGESFNIAFDGAAVVFHRLGNPPSNQLVQRVASESPIVAFDIQLDWQWLAQFRLFQEVRVIIIPLLEYRSNPNLAAPIAPCLDERDPGTDLHRLQFFGRQVTGPTDEAGHPFPLLARHVEDQLLPVISILLARGLVDECAFVEMNLPFLRPGGRLVSGGKLQAEGLEHREPEAHSL